MGFPRLFIKRGLLMIRHILFFSLKSDTSYNAVYKLKNSFLKIPNYIDGVLSVEWGLNNSPENKNEGYSYCVLMTFRDEIVRDIYLSHPEHLKLKEIFLPLLEKLIVLDYLVKSV